MISIDNAIIEKLFNFNKFVLSIIGVIFLNSIRIFLSESSFYSYIFKEFHRCFILTTSDFTLRFLIHF